MAFTNLQRQWQHAAAKRELKLTIPFTLALSDGSSVQAALLLEGYGAKRGMLIVENFATVEEKADAIVAAGYGFSCMSQPSEEKISSLEEIDDALRDWGATNADENEPNQPPEPTRPFGPSGSS